MRRSTVLSLPLQLVFSTLALKNILFAIGVYAIKLYASTSFCSNLVSYKFLVTFPLPKCKVFSKPGTYSLT